MKKGKALACGSACGGGRGARKTLEEEEKAHAKEKRGGKQKGGFFDLHIFHLTSDSVI